MTRHMDAAALLEEARRKLGRLPRLLDAIVGDIDGRTAGARPAPDEWAPVEIVCHLRDEETEDFGARLRVVVGGQTEFTPIDPERWAVERRYREARFDEALAAFRDRRAASLDYLATLAPEQLVAAVPHPRLGTLSGLDLMAAWVAHDQLHLSQLVDTLTRLWALRWSPLRAEYAGPIP